jgi:hypothetical protein
MDKNNTIDTLLDQYIKDPENSKYNFLLARYYDTIGQTATAVSYYLRTAERTTEKELQYTCLILSAKCFERQGSRNFTVKGLYQNAITTCPNRPEAYYFLSKFYESENKDGCWTDAYVMACIGVNNAEKKNFTNLPSDVDYPGLHWLLYQKAHNGWTCGVCDDARGILTDLVKNYSFDDAFTRQCFNELIRIDKNNSFESYYKKDYHNLKHKFPGSESIDRNFSEAFQDMFVLSMLSGKRNGTYLEIGAGSSYYGNNTVLLETLFGWTGIGLDLSEEFVAQHSNERKNPCILQNALELDYHQFLGDNYSSKEIDYLQLDCDPPQVTYEILLKIPFDDYRFAVITYEHDYYIDQTESYRQKSREYLKSKGYQLIISDVSPNNWKSYEDWWVNPDLVDSSAISKLKNVSNKIKKAKNIFITS